MSGATLIVGHRGSSQEAPENTLASFRLAFAEGADGIETDFRLSKDGEIVCLHDERTARTADADLVVADSSFGALRRLDAGSWKGERWRGERIPSLAEVLGILPEGKRCFLELKCGPEILPRLEESLLGSAVPAEKVRILAFSAELISAVKERLPGYRACWLTDYRFRGSWQPNPRQVLETLRSCRADGLASRERSVLDREFVTELRREGHEIHVWTVDRARPARRLVELGVDSIMTNRPGWLRQALAR
ncbi:glycerophosphoryl diester phosphodiesterase [Geomonas limicola]|uniref:Glycerophosphoryl diester phosphodiesterase n=1 Tax=Geomonas limicola TaxID=2740186 RepID=A0A6V8NDI4_9BACT|nr:glycerophosphodiester phosphodiesterase [Geomonas limicola]GFO70500.1 glycerophosphoryl diester phosphodiesterase [Geomonas limicola]